MSIVGTQSIPPALPSGGTHQMLILAENHALVSQGATATDLEPLAGSPGNLQVEHVLNPHLDLAWRSGSITALAAAGQTVLTLQIRFGSPRRLDTLTLNRSNVRVAFRKRYYASTQGSSGGESSEAPLFESPWTDPIVRARLGDFPTYSGMPDYSLGPPEANLDFWQSTFALDSIIFADQTYDNVRMVEVDFDLTRVDQNDGVDYVQVGFLPSWEAFRPRINHDLGGSYSTIDESQATRLKETGALLGRERPRRRAFDFNLGDLERDQALQRLLTLLSILNSALTRVFLWEEPEQRRYFYDTRILGTVTKPPNIVHARLDPKFSHAANAFRIEETQ